MRELIRKSTITKYLDELLRLRLAMGSDDERRQSAAPALA